MNHSFLKFSSKNFSAKINSFSHIKSCMFVPGNQEKMLKKGYNIPSHVLVPDLEDSVPLTEKSNARKLVLEHIEKISLSLDKRLVFPRLNSLSSNLFNDDLDFLFNKDSCKFIDGFVIPKVNSVEEYLYIDKNIKEKEIKYGLKENSLKLIIWIETTKGLVNCKEIFNESKHRVIASAFGAEDYCNDFGIERSENLKEIEVARSIFAFTAHSFNILALDTPNVEFKNPDSIIREIDYIKKLGFKGKFAIHPSQVEIINKNFSPSENELKEAIKIKEEYEKGLKRGVGAISIDGKMVDVPVYKRALNIIARSNN
jgi:citrate lyase beta subunit